MKRRRTDRRTRKSPSQIRRSRLERLEDRHLLAGDTLFFDSFEAGEWAGKWVEDSQNDWSTSSRNSTDGSFSAEVVGPADNATLTLANSIDLSGYDRTPLTFDWAITRSFDLGEYLAFDLSTDGGVNWQNDILRLDGDVDAEGIWHHETVDLTPYASSNFKIRFRSLVSAGNELAGVDNVQIVGITTLPAPPGLVSYWSAEGNALDHQGTNDGTLFNGASYDQGQVGSGFVFDGINDRIDVADSASLELTESMTVETWVRVDSYPSVSNHGLILFRGDDRGGLDPYQLRVDKGGTIRFQVQNAANESAAVLADIPTGQFIHVVATLDNSTDEMKLYLNSVLVASTTTTIRPFGPLDPASNPSVGIGNHGGFAGGSPHNFPFHGVIDELKIYNIPLSQSEVKTNFQATKGNLNPSISIDDSSIVEGKFNYTFVDNLVTANAGGMIEPRGMTLGPDGNLYVSSSQTDSILRYDGTTGAFIDEFVSAGSGGLDFPRELQFQNGYLFVASALSDSVLRFDAVTGAFIDEFVSAGSGGLVQPRGLLFGSNNDLYVTSAGSGDAVYRYDATTGQFIDQFISTGSGGLDNPTGLAMGPDGNFYVTSTSSGSNSVLRYTPNGDYIDDFVPSMSGGLDGPVALLFDEADGLLYVSGARSRAIHAYDMVTGAYIKDVGTSGSGLFQPNALVVDSNDSLLVPDVYSNSVKRFSKSSSAIIEVKLSTVWNEAVSINYATADGADGGATAGSDYVSALGNLVFAPGETVKVISIPILDDSIEEGDETFTVNLSNALGAVIADDQAIGTIHDDDGVAPTIFVSDLDASSSPGSRGKWNATVTVTVVNSFGQAMAGVTVTGFWSDDPSTLITISTDATGKATIYRTNINKNTSSLTFTISNLSLAGYAYDAAANHDDEGDSDGTEILILKP